MPYLRLDRTEIYYRHQGRGPVLLLGHSSAGSGAQWRDLFDVAADRYRLLAPDHLGYGRSGRVIGGPPLIEQELEALRLLVEDHGDGLHLVGHSYGGAILARFAAREPWRVRSLTLIEPGLFYLIERRRPIVYAAVRAVADRLVELATGGRFLTAAREYIDYWNGLGSFDSLDERARRAIVRSVPKLRSEVPTAFEPARASGEALAAVRCPVLLIRGERTPDAAIGVIEVLREIWPAAEHLEIVGAGHMAPVTHAAEVNRAVLDFVDRAVHEPVHPALADEGLRPPLTDPCHGIRYGGNR